MLKLRSKTKVALDSAHHGVDSYMFCKLDRLIINSFPTMDINATA